MSFCQRHRVILVFCTLGLGVSLPAAWLAQRGVPYPLAEPAVQTLPCVSYAPFRRPGASPFNASAVIAPAQIEEDLKLLHSRTRCVRTYGLANGLDAVPRLAARLGMTVRLGAWLGRDHRANQAELEQAIGLARAYPGTVELLIAGNEVLLRRELAPAELATYLAYARAHSPVPVTYADVWEFWLRHAALSAHVDRVTAHILPYWEDEPVAAKEAVAHVYAIAAQVRAAFPGKPVWIGETGWPAAGRQRAGAVPGRVEQAGFVRELMRRAQDEPLDFNLIEGFDQPWKRALEGAMGGFWGLLDAAGKPRFALTGAVQEDADWRHSFATAAVAGGLVSTLLAGLVAVLWRTARLPPMTLRQGGGIALIAALTGALTGASWAVQMLVLPLWNRSPQDWWVSGLLILVSGLAALLFALQLMRALFVPPLAARWQHRLASGGTRLRIALLFCAVVICLVLLFDGRYRPFPWWWFAAPLTLLVALRIARSAPDSAGADAVDGARAVLGAGEIVSPEARLLAVILTLSSIALAITEGWHNAQALGFCAMLLALAWLSTGAGRANTSAASKAAGAPNSAE